MAIALNSAHNFRMRAILPVAAKHPLPSSIVKRLILASASPARRRTLIAAGVDPEIIVSGVDESLVDTADPVTLSGTLARLKANAVAENATPDALVLGCDSVLAFDGEILGKPADAAEATRRWQAMRGRSGILHTGHCLIDAASGQTAEEVARTTVHFAHITDREIARYVETGEPLQVAGAFTIDGMGSPFVERIDGDHGTVVGLSMPLLRRLLGRLGIQITELWRAQ
jgi:septum formation protein